MIPNSKKWLYDFFNGFIDFSKFTEYNVFINYESNTDDIKEIVNELGIKNQIINYIKNKGKILNYINNINNDLSDNIDDSEMKNLFNEILKKFLDFYKKNIQTFNNAAAIMSKLGTATSNFDFEKTNQIKYFENNEDNLNLILEINKNLNKKYELYFHIQNKIQDERVDLQMDSILFDSKLDINCFSTYLSMGNEKCKDTLIKVIKENGYGPESKKFFENDQNFFLFEFFHFDKKEGKNLKLPNLNLIIFLLQRLDFKIKLSPIKFKGKTDNIEELPKYIKYYENFDSWSKHQNISKKLSTQPHLKNYLNHFIEIINRRVILLNPKLKTFGDFFQVIFWFRNQKSKYKRKIQKNI